MPDRVSGAPARLQIAGGLQDAYVLEAQSLITFLALSAEYDDGTRLGRLLSDQVDQAVSHARRLARRIVILGESIPLMLSSGFDQHATCRLDLPLSTEEAIFRAIHWKDREIAGYSRIVDLCDDTDFVTQGLIIELLAEEQEQRTLFCSVSYPPHKQAILRGNRN